MAELFRVNDTLVDAIIKQDREIANNIERRLERWLEYPTFTVGLFGDGSVSAPSISFSSDTDTGFWLSATGEVSFGSGTGQRMSFGSTGIRVIDGSAASPSMSFISDTDTGFYRPSANNLSWTGGETQGGYLHSGGARFAVGSVSAPSLSFLTDTNTGFYNTSDAILWAGAGANGGYLHSGGARFVNGSAAAPSIANSSNTDMGIYFSTNLIGFSINNNTRVRHEPTLSRFYGYLLQDGTQDNGLDIEDSSSASTITKYIRFMTNDNDREGYVGMVGGHIYLTNDVGGNYVRVLSTNVVDIGDGAGTVQLRGTQVRVPNVASSGAATNVRFTGTLKEFREITSMGLYKDDRRSIPVDEALKLFAPTPISWVSSADGDVADQEFEPERRFVGWVAEHFAEAGLDDLLDWNEDGSARSIHYDRVPAYMMVLIETLWNEVFPDGTGPDRPAKSAPDSPGAGPNPDRAFDPPRSEREAVDSYRELAATLEQRERDGHVGRRS